MEEIKRGRGRPRLDTRHTEAHAPSRRQAVNSMYMFEAVQLISEAATEIPDSELLWYSDHTTRSAKSKDGILEQIGRMILQDKYELSDCVYITNLSIAAVKNGYTCREVEKAIRKIRLTSKESIKRPESTYLRNVAGQALSALCEMGES
ncbi:MAG: hypothetical protein ACI4GB_06915 [Acutalibacteraceae bacterium]